jgi:hypothetical protein
MDRTRQLRTLTVTNKVLEVRRIDPYQPADFDGSEPFARVRIRYVAADLFVTHVQDLGYVPNP